MTVKSIKETSGIITLRVTLPIVEVPPALQGDRTVLPRIVKVERAVAVIPTARVVVTELVAELVVLILLALWDGAGLWRWQNVAEETAEVFGADALVVWCLRRVFTRGTVVARV